jgi:transposase-like protein
MLFRHLEEITMSKKASADATVRNIRRKKRKEYSAEEKMSIVIEGLRGELSVAELCRREGSAIPFSIAGARTSWKRGSRAW